MPYPTLAEEIKDMQDEVEAKERKTPQPKVVIDAVNFDGPIHLPDSIREQLITELKQKEFDGDSHWLPQIQEVEIGGAWQDQGYFRVNSTAETQIISSDSTTQHVSVTVHVDEGPQFRLRDVRFRNSDPAEPLPFPDEELRKLVPLREGDLFRVGKIRQGFDALRKLYNSNGYIDFTASPDMEVDEASRRISLVMVLDEQKQYRVGKVEILGVDARTESNLLSKLKPGDIFNSRLIDDFLKENKAALPPDASPMDIEVHRDVRNGIADVRADFRTCQQPRD